MTRINVIPPAELSDIHLLAEIRELPRVRHLSQRLPSGESRRLPKDYVLGRGHVLFFLDKGQWLEDRHKQLILEAQYRGFTIRVPQLKVSWDEEYMKDWSPSEGDRAISMGRIINRVRSNPNQHRWTKRSKPGYYEPISP